MGASLFNILVWKVELAENVGLHLIQIYHTLI